MYASSLAAHIFFSTLAFGFAIALDFVLAAVARSRNPQTIVAIYERVAPYQRWVGPTFGVAILLGFGLMHQRHDTPAQPWLLMTYALVALAGFLGAGVGRRRYGRVLAAARASQNTVTPELESAIAGASPLIGSVMLIVLATLIAIMVFKPLS